MPVYSVSSIFRPDQVFFKWYGRQYGRVLNCFTHFFVQNEVSKDLLEKIGITCVSITGDTRFDRVLHIKEQAKQLAVVEQFLEEKESPKPKVFVAGSSWPPDEDIFIKYFDEHRDWKLIIAPHVIGEDHLQQILSKLGDRKVVRYTEAGESLSSYDTLIIDCFGLLSSIYRYATVCYVGGGFGVSIHNTVEAAVWGVPVIFGPNNEKFQEAQQLKACSGGFEIQGYDDFAHLMDRFDADDDFLQAAGYAAGGYVEGKAGATKTILDSIFK